MSAAIDCLPSATEQKIIELVRRLPRSATSVDSLSDRQHLLGEVLELADPHVQLCCGCENGLPQFPLPCSPGKFVCLLCAVKSNPKMCPGNCCPTKFPPCRFALDVRSFLKFNSKTGALEQLKPLVGDGKQLASRLCSNCQTNLVSFYFAELVCNECMHKRQKQTSLCVKQKPDIERAVQPEKKEGGVCAMDVDLEPIPPPLLPVTIVDQIVSSRAMSVQERNEKIGVEAGRLLLQLEDDVKHGIGRVDDKLTTVGQIQCASRFAAFFQKTILAELLEKHYQNWTGAGWEMAAKKHSAEPFRLLALAKALRRHPALALIRINFFPWRNFRNCVADLDTALTQLQTTKPLEYRDR